MSRRQCSFDRLPVEILHLIFDYISTYDILHGFAKISPYVDRVVDSYHNYQLNFRSIIKEEFDWICRRINPSGVVSLSLADDADTPGQSDLFLSALPLQRFHSTLRALSLSDISHASISKIVKHLDLFDRLLSLRILNSPQSIPGALINLLPKLVRLNLPSQWLWDSFTWMPELEHLIVSGRCNYDQLTGIIDNTPKLISLHVSLEGELGNAVHRLRSNLTRLTLNMSVCHANINRLKAMLAGLSRLKHFEIEARADLDVGDGSQWESFICESLPRLQTFDFKFQLKPTVTLNIVGIQNLLSSFSSPFWLVEKRWFIAIEWEQRLIYSVPRFSCESTDPNFRPPIHCTAPDETIFYDHITALAVWGQPTHRFARVQELWLIDNPGQLDLEAMIDINRVHRMVVVASKADLSTTTLVDLIRKMARLTDIQFLDLPASFVEQQSSSTAVEQIRSLEFTRECQSLECFELFNRLFPRLQRLRVKIQSEQDLQRILHAFSPRLSIVAFDCDPTRMSVTRPWLEKTLGHRNFTFAIDRASIRLWIGRAESIDENQSADSHTHRGCFSWCSIRRRSSKR